jgi:hypothetical protein
MQLRPVPRFVSTTAIYRAFCIVVAKAARDEDSLEGVSVGPFSLILHEGNVRSSQEPEMMSRRSSTSATGPTTDLGALILDMLMVDAWSVCHPNVDDSRGGGVVLRNQTQSRSSTGA